MDAQKAVEREPGRTAGARSETGTGSSLLFQGALALLAAYLCLAPAVHLSAQQGEAAGVGGASVDTRMVEVGRQALRVQTAGWQHRDAGRPVVVLENGAGAPVEAWKPILEAVAGFAPVVAYDRSGIGQSPWDGEPPTPAHVNGRLRTLLKQLGAEPPYVLVGFSWGGPLIQYFAENWPEEVGGLVFIDAPDMRWRMEAELAALAEQGAGAEEREALYRSWDPMIARLPPGHQAELEVAYDAAANPRAWAAAPPAQVPMAILVAARHDPMPPELELPFDEPAYWHALLRESVGRFLASLPASPHATLTVASHARHYMMGDDPQLVVDAIRRVSAAVETDGQQRASIIEVAPPTGTANVDRASILTAVEKALPGDTIQFAPGTYLVGDLVPVATPRLTLLGHADGTVLRGCEPADYDAMDREAVGIFGASPDPDNPRAGWDVLSRCGMMEFSGGHATIRNLTFEYSRLGLLLGCCGAEREFRATVGGYLVEDNTFRNSGNSIRAILSSPTPTVVRNNRFINTFHALSAVGSRLHFVDNHVAVTDPAEVPGGVPGFGIAISSIPPELSADPPAGACEGNVIAGNHVEGHPNGIFLDASPGSTCTEAEIRDNTIIVRRARYQADWPYAALVPLADPSDSTLVGVPLTLWGESGDDVVPGSVVNSVVQGNRILGAEGIGLELRHASRNRILDNTISGVVRREPYPGNLDGPPPEWGEEHNGSGIWVSAGSDENEFRGNEFDGVVAAAIVLRGDRNRVEAIGATGAVRDLGSNNEARVGDTIQVAAPTGEKEDDRVSILTALERVSPGGTVQFAAGTYMVGEMIRVDVPRVTLLGHPGGTTLRGCDPGGFSEFPAAFLECNGFELTGGRQSVRDLTFEYAWHGLHVGCCNVASMEELQALQSGQRREPSLTGGYLIEANTFRDSVNGIRVIGEADAPTLIRGNRFVNTSHAVVVNGRTAHVLDNDVSVPEPARVPYFERPSDGIAVTPFQVADDQTTCAGNVIAGNRVEGHPDAIVIMLSGPGTACRNNQVRDNTVLVRRVPLGSSMGVAVTDTADATVVGVPLALLNVPAATGAGNESDMRSAVEGNVIEGNRILGAEGLAIEVLHASGNRIANNTIQGVEARRPFPGNTLVTFPGLVPGWEPANGSGIWISPGSDENEIEANTFEGLAGESIVVEGDRNRVGTRNSSDTVRDLGRENRVATVGRDQR